MYLIPITFDHSFQHCNAVTFVNKQPRKLKMDSHKLSCIGLGQKNVEINDQEI